MAFPSVDPLVGVLPTLTTCETRSATKRRDPALACSDGPAAGTKTPVALAQIALTAARALNNATQPNDGHASFVNHP